MSLYVSWQELSEKDRPESEYNSFWNTYLEKEKSNYEYILEHPEEEIQGKLTEVAAKFSMDPVIFTGFLDGINTSLVNELKIEEVTEESEISLKVDLEKLYWNMLDARAYWLYTLPQWDKLLPAERRKEITKDYNRSTIVVSKKVGRNDPCTCGSGKKYKKCCGVNAAE